MARSDHRGVAAAVLLLGLASTTSAGAFCRTTTCDNCKQPPDACITEGFQLFWPVSCISYDVQQNASKSASLADATEAARRAFSQWTDVDCEGGKVSFTMIDNGPVSCDKHEYNDQQHTYGGNANIIIFRDSNWVTSDNPNASTLAITTVTFNVKDGQIYDADIEVNGDNPISTSDEIPEDAYDLQSILTHEAGHFLGLAHSDVVCSGDDCPTMNAAYRTGSVAFRSLEPDDKAGICAVYPPDRQSTDSACFPRHGFASECGFSGDKGGCCSTALGGTRRGGGEALFAALLGLGIWFGRGRRA